MLDKTKITSCLPCGLHQPQRNAYFDGDAGGAQLHQRTGLQPRLTAVHNALLHGTGTVAG